MYRTQRPVTRRRRSNSAGSVVPALLLVVAMAGVGAIATNTFGLGERFDHLVDRVKLAINPPPDRPINDVTVTPGPNDSDETPAPGQPTPTPAPTPTLPPDATPLPPRVAMDVKLPADPDKDFLKQLTDEWCAVAGTQIILAIDGLGNNSESFQREIAGRIGEWESRRDSHNGGWGPSAIAAALDAYGAHGYQVVAYDTRRSALRGAAKALTLTQAPVALLSWRGAHTWIITGFRSDADPTIFDDAQVSGLYIFDPWYGWITTLWPDQASKPGTFHDLDNLARNFLPWARPEGQYPDRDGKWILVIPTQPRPNLEG